MSEQFNTVPILVVEDSPDDCEILADAVEGARLANPIYYVEDGADAIDYLEGNGTYSDREQYPYPGLVILDINLPKVNGLQVLERIRSHERLQNLPVVMLTVSNSDEDVLRSYELETVVYIQKPVTSDNLTAVVQSLDQFEIQLVDRI